MRPCPVHDRRDVDVDRKRNEKRSTSLAIYRSTRWRKLRVAYLRDHPWCVGYRGRCWAQARQVDHVVTIEDGGDPWDEANMQALCAPCHSRKTADDVMGRKGGRDRENPGVRDRRGSPARTPARPTALSPPPVGFEPSRRRRPA
jgi:5-methylcytosine-specific restriction protein A